MKHTINPKLRYVALLCGLRGDCITMPGDAVQDMSASGPVDESVAYWSGKIQRDPDLTPDRLRSILKEYGAWDAEQLADDDANWHRALWIAACNCAEDDNPEIAEPKNEEERVAMVQSAWKDDPDSREGCGWDLADRIRTMGAAEWEAVLGGYLRCGREELQRFMVEWQPLDDWAEGVASAAMNYLVLPRDGVVFKGGDFWFEPKLIADSISLRESGIVGIMLGADTECWEEKRKQDIRKLCRYMGAGHVAETAAREGITRVPTILALAAR